MNHIPMACSRFVRNVFTGTLLTLALGAGVSTASPLDEAPVQVADLPLPLPFPIPLPPLPIPLPPLPIPLPPFFPVA